MYKNVKIKVAKSDYIRVMRIVDKYAKRNSIHIIGGLQTTNETTFQCSIFNLMKFKHDVKMLKELGFEIEMVVD